MKTNGVKHEYFIFSFQGFVLNIGHIRNYRMIELKTERLMLRHLRVDDAAAFFSYRSDAVANRYQGWIPKEEQEAIDFIKYRITDIPDTPDTWIQLAIVHLEDKRLIGDIGVYFLPDNDKEVKLGYTLDKNYQGHGYASEALHILIDHLMIRFGKNRFIALISPENEASIRLAKRLGFVQEIEPDPEDLQDHDYPDDLKFVLET
jgi:RimJ/RimL family protein N-acetyltransferase